ncbi:MAG: hypothetical protein ILA34_00065 [Bacteroidaceae bacterium]|nr:hypothetical protein [Bacteroidaceae bacterium]
MTKGLKPGIFPIRPKENSARRKRLANKAQKEIVCGLKNFIWGVRIRVSRLTGGRRPYLVDFSPVTPRRMILTLFAHAAKALCRFFAKFALS